ncbi:MAG: hypothetical protein HZA53_00315 [Planctomycetes bacterium]|nr:hypothetical protein [Planctomycetota bacterium]
MNRGEGNPPGPLDPRDRLVDHVLRELHGLHARRDLTERVSSAWVRGERARDVSAVLPRARRRAREAGVEPTHSIELTVPNTRRKKFALAAAALVVVAASAAVFVTLRGRVASNALARSEVPLRVFRAGEPAELATLELLRGDTVLTGPGEVAFVALADGGRLVLGPDAILGAPAAADSAASPPWTLERGRVELDTTARAFELATRIALVAAPPSSSLAAELRYDDEKLAHAEVRGPAALAELRARLPNAASVLRVAVERGGAEVRRADGVETLAAGVRRDYSNANDPALLVADEQRAKITALLDALRAGPNVPSPFWTDYARRDVEQILAAAKTLNVLPRSWGDAREELVLRAGRDELAPEFARRCVELALFAPRREGIELARALWQVDARDFQDRQVVAWAERGLPEFERESRARVEQWEPGTEPVPLRSAVWAASNGSERARELLRRELARGVEGSPQPEVFDGLVLAALALDLGGDARAWPRAIELLLPGIEGLAAAGMYDAAASYALVLRYVDAARARRDALTQTRFEAEAGPYVLAHRAELADPDALERLLQGWKR